jgi:sulfatase modifying factor 1
MRTCARALSIWIAFSVLAVASSASAVAMLFSPVGGAGNAADTTGFGAVGYDYSVGTYEVTNAQYTEFLNAKAASDPLGLYNVFMGATTQGGITRTGVSGSFTYTTIAGRQDKPVDFVSFYDALRFTNWIANGQGTGDTETGSYTLLGGTAIPANGLTLTRNAGAVYGVTSENEWYKAAFYDVGSGTYFDYPTSSNVITGCAAPTATANRANCNNAAGGIPVVVGAYTGSAGPNGTFDQGGNVWEWNESILFTAFRGIRGGAYGSLASKLAATDQESSTPALEFADVGFRLTYIPEPGTGLLMALGLVGMAARKRSQTR